jgi:hypothetical protein
LEVIMAYVLHARQRARPASTHAWLDYALWIAGAAALGFGVSGVFSGAMEMERNWYLLPYFAIMVPFIIAYIRWTGVDVMRVLRQNGVWGLLGGPVIGAFLVMRMLQEPASPRSEGVALIGDLLWLGLAYGLVDALLLTVLPVSAVWLAFREHGLTGSWAGKVVAGALGLAASLAVTAAYHVGYAEFRGTDVVDPVTGNGVMSLGFLLTANPLTAVIAHVAMHVASVWHGVDTTVTLPPHY